MDQNLNASHDACNTRNGLLDGADNVERICFEHPVTGCVQAGRMVIDVDEDDPDNPEKVVRTVYDKTGTFIGSSEDGAAAPLPEIVKCPDQIMVTNLCEIEVTSKIPAHPVCYRAVGASADALTQSGWAIAVVDPINIQAGAQVLLYAADGSTLDPAQHTIVNCCN